MSVLVHINEVSIVFQWQCLQRAMTFGQKWVFNDKLLSVAGEKTITDIL